MAEIESYKTCGIQKYKFLATLDNRTSRLCHSIDGKIFNVSEAVAGVNVPPIHAYCRSTTVAVVDGAVTTDLKRRANNPITGKYEFVPYDATYNEWYNSLTSDNSKGIMDVGRDKNMTISAIEKPIEQRNTAKGNPNAVLLFDRPLNNRQQLLFSGLSKYEDTIIVDKNSVNMKDLSALTAHTGVEFAMFTKGNKRLIIRGNSQIVNIDIGKADELSQLGYRWSGHTHPGIDYNSISASDGDYEILKRFKQKTSVIYNSKGQFLTFDNVEV